jgi:magnesium-transporting ATPase (P-type)
MSATVNMDGPQEEFYWHSKPVEEVERLQETNKSTGLSSSEAKRRLEAYGLNELPAPPKTPFYMKLWAQLNNILIFILIGATIVAGILEDWAEVSLICGVVVINVSIGLIQEGKAEKAADAIKGMLAGKAVVTRDGADTEIMAVCSVPVLSSVCCVAGWWGCAAACLLCVTCDHCGAQNEVVPGDIVVITAGDQVPADLRVFEATNLKVAEDSLTGGICLR